MNLANSQIMKHAQDTILDFIFIGLGASNSLILLSLAKKGLLNEKKIAVFEPDSKKINDKTFCFWSEPEALIVEDLVPIISHVFDTIKVGLESEQKINDQPYYYIRSIDLYDFTLQKIIQEKVQIYREGVNEVKIEADFCAIQTSQTIVKGHYIFDSRPPLAFNLSEKEIYLNQSFYGVHIKCEGDSFLTNTFEMMNFNVPQHAYTQFIYVIPFSTNEALVELTRFGKEKIELLYATQVLENFIKTNYGNYKILADERGCIPMTTFVNPHNKNKRILNTGVSANLIKPSTGYGFKKMHAFANLVSNQIFTNDLDNFNQIALPSKKRFKFYDKLLLIILLHWPSKGKLIFTCLFEKQPVKTVFTFLDEKSSILQEIKIFATLPIFRFLKALYCHLKGENLTRSFGLLLIVISYSLIAVWNIQIAEYYSYLILTIGMLAVGIPHGALDHLILKNKTRSSFFFIFNYLLVVGSYFILWQFYPEMSLFIFVLYSSYHFGESELIETNNKLNSVFDKFNALMIGLSILTFIIFVHSEESLSVISYFITFSESFHIKLESSIITLVIPSLSLLYLLILNFLSKKRPYSRLVFLLLIGINVPLLLAFGLYFIFQHSANSWQHLKSGLKMNSTKLYRKSLAYTGGALLIFTLIIFYANELKSHEGWIANFFIFIACISFPHFFIMHIFYKSKNETNN